MADEIGQYFFPLKCSQFHVLQAEICAMAWRLLTEVYQLPTDRLYVTYFAGDPQQVCVVRSRTFCEAQNMETLRSLVPGSRPRPPLSTALPLELSTHFDGQVVID